MKFNDILNEINMAPNVLFRRAQALKPLVGMEFEMVINVPPDQEFDLDIAGADYSHDPFVRDISQIESFFESDHITFDHITWRQLRRACIKIQKDYDDFVENEKQREWDHVEEDYVKNYIEDHYGDDPNDEEDKEEALENWDRHLMYQDAYDDWESSFTPTSESDWLRNTAGIHRMSDVPNHYDLVWPYYEQEENNSSSSGVQQVANSFASYVPGFKVVATQRAHEVNRNSKTYSIEPDSSVHGSKPTEQGLELVSPKMYLEQMFDHYEQVVKWAKFEGHYTNDTCGLHINVSVPSYNRTKLDYVKLVLLVGDQHILGQFGRLANSYCRSSYELLRRQTRLSKNATEQALEKARHHLNLEASRLFYSFNKEKHVSINAKTEWVEFRAAGGNWLAIPVDQIFNTVNRFVVALSSAMHPEQDRQEYAKKFYKMLSHSNVSTDHIKFFADYVAGRLDKNQLKAILKHEQQHKKLSNVSNNPKLADTKAADDHLYQYASELHPDYQNEDLDEVKITDNPTAGFQFGELEKDPDAWIGRDYGAGLTGINRNIDYEGYRVSMKPSKFLALATPLPDDWWDSSDVERHLAKGGSIGAPFLYVTIPEDWTEQGKFTQPATVTGHEGRHRMRWILRNEGDDPVEVHMVFRGGLRRRHVTDQMMAAIKKELLSQKNNSASQRIVTNTFVDYKK